jgi:hypothetical protein
MGRTFDVEKPLAYVNKRLAVFLEYHVIDLIENS